MFNHEKLTEILNKYIPEGKVFVEIGAYDGETNSHTVHLADEGWRGYYFEPVLEYAVKCAKRHKENNVEVFPVAVGIEGIKTFYVSEQLSTLNGIEYQKKVTNLDWFKGSTFHKKQIICVNAKVLPACDLLVIDVEGSEYEILKNMKIQPIVLIIELHEKSKEWKGIVNVDKSLELLNDMGYTKIYSDEIDSIFIYA